MIDNVEVERLRVEAERCKYKTGTLGVWARHWLALYKYHLGELDRINTVLTEIAEESDG
jgi:hypothetical protein